MGRRSLRQEKLFKTKAGQVVVIYLGGISAAERFEFYRIVTSPQRALIKGPHMKTALEIIRDWPSRTAKESRTQDPKEPYRTAPGEGIKPSEIEMFMLELEPRPQPLGMPVEIETVAVMALKNGEYCRAFDVPPSDMDAAQDKRVHPVRWGKWRKRGDAYEIFDEKRGWQKAAWRARLYPAARDDQLLGVYARTASIATGTYSRVTSGASYNFLPGGRFEFGSIQIFSGRIAGSAKAKPKGGSFSLDGSTLELRWDDGKVERRTFLWGNRADKKAFLWGTQAWLRNE